MAKFMKDLRKLCYTLPFFLSALVAQLDRAFDCGSKGQGFEFLRAHHYISKNNKFSILQVFTFNLALNNSNFARNHILYSIREKRDGKI